LKVLALLLCACLLSCAYAVPQTGADQGVSDVDARVRRVVTETAVFIEECGAIFPGNKATLDAAFANWSVLKLPIPTLAEALRSDSPDRTELTKLIGPYLRRIPAEERGIECSGRYEVLLSNQPQLVGDSASLPQNVLDRYKR